QYRFGRPWLENLQKMAKLQHSPFGVELLRGTRPRCRFLCYYTHQVSERKAYKPKAACTQSPYFRYNSQAYCYSGIAKQFYKLTESHPFEIAIYFDYLKTCTVQSES